MNLLKGHGNDGDLLILLFAGEPATRLHYLDEVMHEAMS
jgi:hypothetical protein